MRSTDVQNKVQKQVQGASKGRPLNFAQKQLRAETAKWFESAFAPSSAPVFGVTLTCKEALRNSAGGFTRLTNEELSNQLDLFFRRLDRAVYKNASRRFGKGLRRVCATEGGDGTGTRPHAHMLIEGPPSGRMSWWAFMQLIRKEWQSGEWSLPNIWIDPCPDVAAAGSYYGKTGADALDWRNSVF